MRMVLAATTLRTVCVTRQRGRVREGGRIGATDASASVLGEGVASAVHS
jgi:hypothetical protein